MQCYAPCNYSSEDEKDQFYYSLKTVVEEFPTHDLLVVMRDLNTKIGNENSGLDFQQLLEYFPPFSMKGGNEKKYQKIGGRV